MNIQNNSRRTEAEITELVTLALIARRAHACRSTKIAGQVAVHDGIHTQYDTHTVLADVEGVTVQFFRYRQHSPCKGKYYHEVAEPYGFNGIEIEADNSWITISY